MRENLNWAVLGTGVIANEMAQALQKMGKSLYAVGNRTHQKAIKNKEKYGGIIEYYESCREYIGKYYLRFERIWSGYAIQRISAFDIVEKIFVLNGYVGRQ